MAKLSLQFAVFGLGSFLFISTASALELGVGTDVEIYDFACDQDPTSYTFTLTHTGTTDPITLGASTIDPNADDTLPSDISNIDVSTTCTDTLVLNPADTCTITVVVDPTVADLPLCEETDTGVLDRTLHVPYNQNSTDFILDIELDAVMCPLGHGKKYSVLTGTLNANANPTVNHFVGAPNGLTGNIIYQNGAHRVINPFELTHAFNSVKATYNTYSGLASTGCTNLPNQLNQYTGPIYPGIYCFGTTGATQLSIIDELEFNGPGRFVFVMPSTANLIIGRNTTYSLANGASPRDIYWVFTNDTGTVTMEPTVQFPGTIVSRGNFVGQNAFDLKVDSASWINGAILDTQSTSNSVTLNGNAVLTQ